MLAPSAALIALVLVAADGGAPGNKPFRTDVAPRMDPVFQDTAALREAIDQFFALNAEMETARDELSAAVHDTLAQLGPVGGTPPTTCPAAVPPLYARASEAGRRFLALGRRFAARYRDIRRADDLGDTVGLTPDYRARAKKTRDLYAGLVRDYREARVSFYDQLEAEMRHAGCKLSPATTVSPSDWVLEPPASDTTGAKRAEPEPAERAPAAPAPSTSSSAPGIWIQIDNTRCPQPSSLTIDGAAIGNITAQKKIGVRTHAGPHELCVLPATDKRVCGAPGTVRRVYLYEGWTLAVRCEK